MAKNLVTSHKVLVGRSLVWTTEGSEEVSKENYMKRYGNLYERVISLENLRLADEKARKGKLHTYGVRMHDKNRERNILTLHDALVSKTYHTSKYSRFMVYEPKEREIYRLPYYPDRIVHHAIMNVLEDVWVKTFTYNSYSCIKRRGIHGCARRVKEIFRRYDGRPLYCLKIDVRKYYPSISHDVLKRLVRRKIKDENLLWLLDEIIDSTDGLPIGNYLSQYLANLYLAYFMHYVNETLRVESCEYADDIVFFSDNKETLRRVLLLIREYLSRELRLTLKRNFQVFPIGENRYDRHGRSLDYVGYAFYRRQTLIRKSIKRNFARRVARLNRVCEALELYKREVSSWLGWAKYSDSRNLLRSIIKTEFYNYLYARCA